LVVEPAGYRRSVDDEHGRRRVAVVVNPQRTELADELLERIGADVDGEVIRPDDADGLADGVRRAAYHADVVAAVGGDGTQATAAAALAGTGAALAVVPGGTVNLLARILGVDSVEAAAGAIVSGTTRTIDLGDMDGRTFVLNASSGFDAAMIRRVDDGAKRWGRLGYFASGVRELSSHTAERVSVSIDGDPWFAGRAMTVMVTNFGQRGSPGLTVAPGASPDDGELDVVVQRCDTAATMSRAIWALVRGREPREEDLLVGHGRRIDVEWGRPAATQTDGDAVGRSDTIRHEVRPAQLRLRCRRSGTDEGDGP
jgi:diacylglycerol kinase family enzyme